MRAFLAIPVPEDVRLRLAAVAGRLASVATEVTWCKREQLHLTLLFLGEVAPAILPHVTACAERICAEQPPFPVRVFGLGYFGTKRNPQTLWAGVDPSPQLDALHERIGSELKRFGFAGPDKEYRPHITLGRCPPEARNRSLVETLADEESLEYGAWEAGRVTLYESRPSPRGPVYRNLAHIALG